MRLGPPDAKPRPVAIESLAPQVDGGRFAVKRSLGEPLEVEADVFAPGHDLVRCVLKWRPAWREAWSEVPMHPLGNDRWVASFTPAAAGDYIYAVEGWRDEAAGWLAMLERRRSAGQVESVDWEVGARLLERAAEEAAPEAARALRAGADRLRRSAPVNEAALRELIATAGASLGRSESTEHPPLPLVVDSSLARFGAWFEVFPRSLGAGGAHGTFADLEKELPGIAQMGFDVVYLPPIHPIGATGRKGPGNRPGDAFRDVGSPWAIGSREGGHKSVHPALGDLAAFRRLLGSARQAGLEIALDLAFQCSPDHPYLAQHPSWFRQLPDGRVRSAENPPKRYEDIVPLDFDSADWRELWLEMKAVCEFWIGQGVRIFRVDNPHTKPFAFWEWLITSLRAEHPELVFLSEAFTRPRVMERLAKLGFNQSYTYFAWRDSAAELRSYLTELTQGPVSQYLRPNLWPNTPDILTAYLQQGGRPAFVIRLILAATLGASYGIYGPAFLALEDRATAPASEEYLDSEKYQLRHWVYDPAMVELVTLLNRLRHENPAFQEDRSLSFHDVDNPDLLLYSKGHPDGEIWLMAVTLDPHHVQSGWTALDLERLGLEPEEAFEVSDLLSGETYRWRGVRNFVRLDPAVRPAHVLRVRRTPGP